MKAKYLSENFYQGGAIIRAVKYIIESLIKILKVYWS